VRVIDPSYIIKLRSLRPDRASIHGLRAILKRLLRDHQFRCVSAIEIPAQQESPPVDTGQMKE